MNTTIRKVIQRGFIILLLATVIQSANAAIVVSTGATTGATYSAGTYTCNSTSAVINVTELQGYLASTNVVIDGTSQGTDVTVSNAISWSSAFSLTIKSRQSFTLSAAISNGGSGAVTLLAGQGVSGSLFVNGNVTTNNGAIKLYQGVDASGTQRNFTGGVMIGNSNSSTILSNGGDITIQNSTSGSVSSVFEGAGIRFGVDASSGSAVIDAGTGSIDMKGYGQPSSSSRSIGIFIQETTTIQASGSGNITLYGQSKNSTDWSDGIVFMSNNYDLHTENGNIQLSGTGGANTGYYAFGITFQGTATTKIYSTTGNITLKGYSNATSYAAIRKHNAGSTIYIGTNNSGITTSGNIIMQGDVVGASNQLFTTAGGNFVLAGTGDLTIGSDAAGSGNSGITIASGMISGTGWKSVSIGDVRTSAVTLNSTITTSAASTAGIAITSKTDVTINNALNTSAATGAPVTVLAAQGAAGTCTMSNNIYTAGGVVKLYAGVNASGTDLGFLSTVTSGWGIITNYLGNAGANVFIRNSRSAGGNNDHGVGVGDVVSGIGNITIQGTGKFGTSSGWREGIFITDNGDLSANTGTISIDGKGGTGVNMSSGITMVGNSSISTTSGDITLLGTGNNTVGNRKEGIWFYGDGTTKTKSIYSTSGNININSDGYGNGMITDFNELGQNGTPTTNTNVYIGYNGTGNGTTGNITIKSSGKNDGKQFIWRSTGTFMVKGQGDLSMTSYNTANASSDLILSGVVQGTNWKNVTIGDTYIQTVTVSDPITTSAASTAGILITSKASTTINSALATTTGSTAPITMLVAQGAAGLLTVNNTITTQGGDILAYAGRTAATTGYNTGFAGQFNLTGTSSLHSNGGNINIKTGDGATVTGGRNTLSQIIDAGGGNIDIYGKANAIAVYPVNSDIKTSGSGSVKIYGVLAAGTDFAGMLFDGTTNRITTVDGGITLTGDGTTTMRGIGVYTGTATVTSTTGAITMTGLNTSAFHAIEVGVNGAATLNVGYDGTTGAGTTGNITINGSATGTGSIYLGDGSTKKTFIKSNGGAVTIGDNGSALGGLTLNSGTIISSTNGYKSFYIGGTNTSGVTVNTPLTTNTTATVAGIQAISKADLSVNAPFSTTAKSGIPITLLSGQGTFNSLLNMNTSLSTTDGNVIVYASRNAAGADISGSYGQVKVYHGAGINAGTGTVLIKNTTGGGNNVSSWIDASGLIFNQAPSGGVISPIVNGYPSITCGRLELFGKAYNGYNEGTGVEIGGLNVAASDSVIITGIAGTSNTTLWGGGIRFLSPSVANPSATTIYTTHATAGIKINGTCTATIGSGLIVTSDGSNTSSIQNVQIYTTSKAGSVEINAIGQNGSRAILDNNGVSSVNMYVGYDNGSNVTTGDIRINMQGASSTLNNFKIKSNGGAVKIGDNGSALGALTLNNGTIVPSGSYKSFTIGGVNTSGVTINIPLTTNAASTAGISITSKSGVELWTGADLNTSASTGSPKAPVNIVSHLSNLGNTLLMTNITTNGGDINITAGTSNVAATLKHYASSTLNSAGGNITLSNGTKGSSGTSGGSSDGVGVQLMGGTITSGAGTINIKGYGATSGSLVNTCGIDFEAGTINSTSGGITMEGISYLQSNTVTTGNSAGILFRNSGTVRDVHSDGGNITIKGTGPGTAGSGYWCDGIYFIGSVTHKIYSNSGNITLQATSTNANNAAFDASASSQVYIGWDGTSPGTSGTISILGNSPNIGFLWAETAGLYKIKGTGNLKMGSLAATANGYIYPNALSGSILGSNWKKIEIGDVYMSSLTLPDNLTTGSLATSTDGIYLTAKGNITVNGALNTSAATGVPVTVLAAQGAAGYLLINGDLSTKNGAVKCYAGVDATATNSGYSASVVVNTSKSITSLGGDIFLRNGTTGGYNDGTWTLGNGISLYASANINAGGGNIALNGFGKSSDVYVDGIYLNGTLTTSIGNITIYGKGGVGTTRSPGLYISSQGTTTIYTTTGDITLTGENNTGGTRARGIMFDGNTSKIYSTSGNITFNASAYSGNGAIYNNTGSAYIGYDNASTITSGNINLFGDDATAAMLINNATFKIQGSNGLTIKPRTSVGNNGFTLSGNVLGTAWKGITLGDVYTGAIILNDNLTTTTNGINLTSKSDISGTGNMVANGQNITITTTPTSLGAAAYTGSITGTASLVRLGTDFALNTEAGNIFLMTGTGNTFTGNTTITSGELRLNPSADVSNWASPMVMNGGRLSTKGIFAGRSWTSTATLTVSETSKIKLENNVHQLHFANSTGTTWLSTAMLGIDGWKGSYGTSGFKGRFYISNAPGGLNPEQVTNTRFKNTDDNAYYVSTCILDDGEVVPYGLPSTFETTQTGNYESSITWGKSGTAVWGLTYPGITNDFTIAADHIVAINSTNDYSSGTVTIAGTGGLASNGVNTHFGAINAVNSASSINLTNAALTIGDSGNLRSAFAGTISGTGGITKDGTGMLTLSGTSTNSGATTIAKGTIKLESATAASAASTVTIANTANALFDLNGYSATIGGLSGGGATGGWVINNGSADATLTFGSNNAATTYAGIIKNGTTNKTAVVKAGTGTTIFSGVNTYTGGTTINGGQLTVAAVGGLPNNANSPVIVNAGTFNAAVSDIFGTDFVNVVTPVTINLGGTVTNSGTYYSLIGPLNMNGGTLTSVGGNSTTYPSWGLGGAVTVTDNSTISATGTNAGINLGSATTISTVPFDVAAGKTLTVSAKLQNGASITSKIAKNGTGTMLISGDNTYDKATLNSGILKLGSAGNGSSGPLGTSSVNLYGGYLDLNGFSLGMSKSLYLYTLSGGGMINSSSTAATWSGTVGFGAGPNPASIISTGNILLTSTSQLNLYSGSTLVLDGTAMGSSLANQLSNTLGAGNLEKTGTGIWTLTNAGNSYLGTTTITQGELRLNPTANATFASQVIMNGGTLGTANIALNRTHTSSSTLKLAASSTLALGSNAHTLTFANSSAVSWAEGVLTITGWQGAFNSTTGTAGKLVVGGATGALTVTQLAQIRFLKAADSKYYAATQLGTGEVVATGTLFGKTWTGATSTDWNVATNWVPQSVPIASDDVIIPTGLTNYPIIGAAGGTCNDITVNGGSLTINSTGTLNGGTYAGNISIASGLYLNLYSTADQVLSGVISGAGLINKNNTGTLILSGNNTFSGIFKIYDGTVKLGSAGSGANGPLGTTANETSIMNDSYLDLNGYTLATAEPIRFLGGKLINSSAVAVTYSGLLSFNASDVNAGMIATGNIMLTGSTFDLLSGGTLTLDGTSTGSSIANQIINSGGTACNLTKTGTGSWTLTNTANSYSGTTTVTEGELRLNPSGNATFASQVVMNGGTLSTAGITATRTFTSSVALNMTASSTLALGSNAHTLTFANSSAVSWSTGVLTITGWQGSFNSTAGTNAKLFVGSGTGALTATQLSMIRIYNTADSKYYTAAQLGTGEVVATATLFGKTWTGATSTNWNVASNWAPSGVPAITDDITIPTGLTNYPVIGAAGGTCANIAINGGSLTIATTGRLNGGVFAGTISIALGTNFNCNSSASQSISGVISGAGAFTKNGTGTLTLSGDNTYSGVTNFNTGTVKLGSAGTASSGPLGSITQWPTLNGILDLNGFTPNFTEIISIGAGTIINSSSIPATYKGGIHGSTSIGFNSSVGDIFITYPSLNLLTGATLTLSGVGTGSSISSSIANLSGISNLTKTGTGTWTLSNPNNSYIGTTTITQGELRLNPTANATFASQVVLNGGTLGTTGIAATSFTSTSTLNMTASSTLALGSAVHTLTFADSRAVSWSTGVLTITGWTGAFDGTAGTSAKLFVGSDAGGLTAAQLAMIKFENSGQTYSAIQLSTGEVVAGTSLFVSVQTGNWNDPATWGKPAGSVEGVNYPGATDAVTVSAGHTVTLTAAANGGKLTCTGNLSLGTYNLTFGSLNGVGNINMGTATLSRSIANDGHLDASTFDGVMSGAGNLTLAEGGIFTITKSQTFTGTTTLSTATIKFNPTAVTMDWASPIVLNDGSLSTEGIAANATVTSSSTLAVNGYSSEIKMDEANVHSLKFANSSTQSISLIAILGWQGGFNSQPGSMGRLYFGTASGGLSDTQLSNMYIYKSSSDVDYPVIQLATGEVVAKIYFHSVADGDWTAPATWDYSGTPTAGVNYPGTTNDAEVYHTVGLTDDVVTSGAVANDGIINFNGFDMSLGAISLNGTYNLGTSTLTLTGSTDYGISGRFNGAGQVIKQGAGTFTSDFGGDMATNFKVEQGVLSFKPYLNGSTYSGQLEAAGGTISFNAGFTSSSTLQLTNNSTLALDNAATSITFSNTSGVSWTSGKALTITNWTGTFDGVSSGTTGKLYFGGDNTGLSAAQLKQIRFLNTADSKYYTATQLGTGEVVATATLFGQSWILITIP